MGAFDTLLSLSDAQALTESAASTNYIDMEVVKHYIGVGGDAWLCLRTNVAADFTTTDETYLVGIEHDSDSGFATTLTSGGLILADTDGTAVVTGDLESTPLKTAGLLVYASTIPMNVTQRYLRLYYTLGGTTPTWTVDAWIQTYPPKGGRNQVWTSPVSNP